MSDAQRPRPSPEQFRSHLRLLAGLLIDRYWQGKIDPSSVVQQTLLEAHKARDQFEGWNEAQLVGWLCTSLANNVRDEVEKHRTRSRDVTREKSIQEALNESSGRVARWLADRSLSPADLVEHQEQLGLLAEALEKLPADQQAAVRMKYLLGLSVREIADRLGRTQAAVSGLICRGIKRLHQLLDDMSGGSHERT